MVRLEILRAYTGIEGSRRRGDIIVVDDHRAREILANPARARIVYAPPKPAEPEAKKSSGARNGGRSTGLRSSNARGRAVQSSASPAAPASAPRSAGGLKTAAKRILGLP